MKRNTLIILLFLVLIFNKTYGNNWLTSLEDARKIAIAQNKLILVDFWATWCAPCKKMDYETWSNSEVQELMSNFVKVKIDISSDRNTAMNYSVRAIPYVFILDPNGKIVYSKLSYMPKNEVNKLLKKYSLNTAFLQNDLINFYKNKTSLSAIKLAEKYLDFSTLLDNNIKYEFLRIGNMYLKDSGNLAKNEEKNSDIKQRIDLLKLYTKLIKEKYEIVIKTLDKKYSKDNIVEENNPLFNFLYYASYDKLGDKINAKLWYKKLRNSKDYHLYLLKSRKI